MSQKTNKKKKKTSEPPVFTCCEYCQEYSKELHYCTKHRRVIEQSTAERCKDWPGRLA